KPWLAASRPAQTPATTAAALTLGIENRPAVREGERTSGGDLLRRVGPTQVAHLRFVTAVDETGARNGRLSGHKSAKPLARGRSARVPTPHSRPQATAFRFKDEGPMARKYRLAEDPAPLGHWPRVKKVAIGFLPGCGEE